MRFEDQNWNRIIEPSHKVFSLELKNVWDYRDLIKIFIRRDIVVNYKQTILGPIWFLIQPILSTLMYIIVFGGFAQMGTDGIPQLLFYYVGTMTWGYFSSTITAQSNIFNANKNIFGKVYFPRFTVVISTLVGVIIKTGIQFGLFIVFYIYYIAMGSNIGFSWRLIFLPAIFLWLGFMASGIGLVISAITTKYHDLAMAMGYILSLFMYVTPVVYPMSEVPEKFRMLFDINPVSAPIECFRIACFGAGNVHCYSVISSVVFTIAVLFLGMIMFNKNEKTFIDVI